LDGILPVDQVIGLLKMWMRIDIYLPEQATNERYERAMLHLKEDAQTILQIDVEQSLL
jgi:hypothetical protein